MNAYSFPAGASLRGPGLPSAEVTDALRAIVSEHALDLVGEFYSCLLEDEHARKFLSHSVVQERLSGSMANWLMELFTPGEMDADAMHERQRHIGSVHARLRIPLHLVLQGADLLKKGISHHLLTRPLSDRATAYAIVHMNGRIDYAMRVMSEAYVSGTAKRAVADDAYRRFALGQDLGLERETQRAALMEWSQNTLFAILRGASAADIQPLRASAFGLWIRYRAVMLFEGSPMLDSINDAMAQIDKVQATAFGDGTDDKIARAAFARLQALTDTIKFLLMDMFRAAESLEQGRDPLTQALNRRFLPSVLSREISVAASGSAALSILMVDIDHFKSINDRWGHPAGDTVLRQVAEILIDECRKTDFVFRFGGEEFLLLLMETDASDAIKRAETIRNRISEHGWSIGDQSVDLTVSIGCATYDGHPDYNYLVGAADRALYRAKESGRNRVESAE